MIPKLTKTETLLFLNTKNQEHQNFNPNKPLVFAEGKEETILNDYPNIAFSFSSCV